jgi:hypothetical protein
MTTHKRCKYPWLQLVSNHGPTVRKYTDLLIFWGMGVEATPTSFCMVKLAPIARLIMSWQYLYSDPFTCVISSSTDSGYIEFHT